MTGEVRRSGTGNIDQLHPENFAFRIPETELVAVSNLFVEAAEKHRADYPGSTVYQYLHPFSADNSLKTVPICLITNIRARFVKKPGFTNSIPFPPFYCWEQEVTPAPATLI